MHWPGSGDMRAVGNSDDDSSVALAHHVCTSFRQIAAPCLGSQRGLWQFALPWWGISLRLSALAVLLVLSMGVASANDRYHPHLRSLNDYVAGRIPEEGIFEDSLLGLILREDQRYLKSGASHQAF